MKCKAALFKSAFPKRELGIEVNHRRALADF